MTKQMFKFTTLVVVILTMTACTVSKEDHEALRALVLNEQQKREELANRVQQLSSQLNTISTELKEEISRASSPMQSKQANLWAEVEQLKVKLAMTQDEFQRISRQSQGYSQFESNATENLSSLKEEVDTMRMVLETQLALDFEKQLTMIEEPVPTPMESDSTATSVSQGQSTQAAPVQTTDTAKALYDTALGLFKKREYSKAQELWSEFVRNYPSHRYVPNAIFWQGECFYQMKDYSRAVLSYQDVISKYSSSTKYAPALLKQGISFIRLGKKKAGALVLQDLIAKKPNSPEAVRAKKILK